MCRWFGTVNAIVDSAVFVAEMTALVAGRESTVLLRGSDVLAGRAVLAGFAAHDVMPVDGVLAPALAGSGAPAAPWAGRLARALRSAWSLGSPGLPAGCRCAAVIRGIVGRTAKRHERDRRP